MLKELFRVFSVKGQHYFHSALAKVNQSAAQSGVVATSEWGQCKQ
jgi:hypothetical protein